MMRFGWFLILLAQAQAGDEFPAPKKISLSLTKAPLAAAAERLAKAGGYPIKLGECDPKAIVSMKVDKVPFVLALDALCRSAGAGYRWQEKTIELLPFDVIVPSASSVAQIGPFSMRAWHGPWDKGIPAVFIDTDWEPSIGAAWFALQLEQLQDEKGDKISLTPPKFPPDYSTNDNKVSELSSLKGDWKRDWFPYTPPAAGAPKLKSVSGTAVFAFPKGKKNTVRFDLPKDKMTKTVDGFPISLEFFQYDAAKKIWSTAVMVECSEAPLDKKMPLYGVFASSRVRFFGKGGSPLLNEHLGGTGSGGKGNDLRYFQIKGHCRVADGTPLTAVEVDFYSDVTLKTYPFQFNDLPEVIPKK
jgi:hypothetical protein